MCCTGVLLGSDHAAAIRRRCFRGVSGCFRHVGIALGWRGDGHDQGDRRAVPACRRDRDRDLRVGGHAALHRGLGVPRGVRRCQRGDHGVARACRSGVARAPHTSRADRGDARPPARDPSDRERRVSRGARRAGPRSSVRVVARAPGAIASRRRRDGRDRLRDRRGGVSRQHVHVGDDRGRRRAARDRH